MTFRSLRAPNSGVRRRRMMSEPISARHPAPPGSGHARLPVVPSPPPVSRRGRARRGRRSSRVEPFGWIVRAPFPVASTGKPPATPWEWCRSTGGSWVRPRPRRTPRETRRSRHPGHPRGHESDRTWPLLDQRWSADRLTEYRSCCRQALHQRRPASSWISLGFSVPAWSRRAPAGQSGQAVEESARRRGGGVLRRQGRVARRPGDADRRIVPGHRELVLGVVEVGALVLDVDVLAQDAEAVGEAGRDPELAEVLAGEDEPTHLPKVGEPRRMSTATSNISPATARTSLPWGSSAARGAPAACPGPTRVVVLDEGAGDAAPPRTSARARSRGRTRARPCRRPARSGARRAGSSGGTSRYSRLLPRRRQEVLAVVRFFHHRASASPSCTGRHRSPCRVRDLLEGRRPISPCRSSMSTWMKLEAWRSDLVGRRCRARPMPPPDDDLDRLARRGLRTAPSGRRRCAGSTSTRVSPARRARTRGARGAPVVGPLGVPVVGLGRVERPRRSTIGFVIASRRRRPLELAADDLERPGVGRPARATGSRTLTRMG